MSKGKRIVCVVVDFLNQIRCWIVQMLMPKELRIEFQLFLIEEIKKIEQELEDIAYGKEKETTP